MRFIENGPDIPDTLIEERDLGEVVFFCGAGISGPVGLPDFGGLADDLLDRLAAQESRTARKRGESLDRVFMAMVKEFGGTAVDREISRALRAPRKADPRHHRVAIDLSRGADGGAKIVTTNFDLLFERADKSLLSYIPPALPDLAQLQPIQGIVYLHGRLKRTKDARGGYIITSADLGRAYLAEGWAARFVRALSERYTIVLLGYSANDPPMRYLLEGLNSRDDPARRSLIYAFVPEGPAAGEESWHDKGVTTIPYAPRDKGHNGLWDSLFAWAAAARDPETWRAGLVKLAQRQPAELKAFERGQVAHLVSSRPGASAFATATPPPPAEWLCVFDAYSRYAKPGWLDRREKIEIDPLDVFGLDSDPPRPEERPGSAFVAPGEDMLGWRHGDQQWPERQRLSGYRAEWNNQLPSRLHQLAHWFGLVMDQPAAIWWAAGRPLPHPGLVREIDYRLDRGAILSGKSGNSGNPISPLLARIPRTCTTFANMR
ncbi:MAG: SIR2 family protein [Sphingosinicella sp.]|nr:SIR2 family protein [Sphingosinicella sp.]